MNRSQVGTGGSLAVGGAMDFFEDGEGFFESGRVESDILMLENPADETLVEDIGRHRGFELGIADEEYHWQECVAWQAEALDERADMEVVLMERI